MQLGFFYCVFFGLDDGELEPVSRGVEHRAARMEGVMSALASSCMGRRENSHLPKLS